MYKNYKSVIFGHYGSVWFLQIDSRERRTPLFENLHHLLLKSNLGDRSNININAERHNECGGGQLTVEGIDRDKCLDRKISGNNRPHRSVWALCMCVCVICVQHEVTFILVVVRPVTFLFTSLTFFPISNLTRLEHVIS